MKIDYKFALSASELVAKRKDGKVLLSHKQLPEDGILTIDESDIAVLSEGQILEAFNNYIRDLQEAVEGFRPREVPDGEAQIEKDEENGSWVTCGDVLRSYITWKDGENGKGAVAFQVDENMLSAEELIKILEEYEGWGMRIEFMHPNRLTEPPEPEIY